MSSSPLLLDSVKSINKLHLNLSFLMFPHEMESSDGYFSVRHPEYDDYHSCQNEYLFHNSY